MNTSTEALDGAFLQELRAIAGPDNVYSTADDCWAYGYDNSRRHQPPGAVVLPHNHEQVQRIVALCYQRRLPLVARGLGTGTTGASVPPAGGLVLSSERMNRIISIDTDNRVAVVQPGVTNQALQDELAKSGFFWPPDPTSAAYCTIGGNLAYNSAGPRAIKYGTPRENTLGLTVVTGRGETLRCGVYTTKGVVGYDLTRLLIGSEGTLGVITEATLKITPLPAARSTLRASYRDMRSATRAVAAIMAQPVTPCVLEFIDGRAIDMIRGYSGIDLPPDTGALLMIEVDGSADALPQAVAGIGAAAANEGLMELRVARNEDEVKDLWRTRKALSPALRTVAPKKINEDVVVPVSHIPDLIDGLNQLALKYNIAIINFGHAGNGNIHVNLLVNPDDAAQAQAAEHCLHEVFDLVIRLRGTLSGEHGVGLEKMPFITKELSPAVLGVMRGIKQVFDPANILNPGKLFPDA